MDGEEPKMPGGAEGGLSAERAKTTTEEITEKLTIRREFGHSATCEYPISGSESEYGSV